MEGKLEINNYLNRYFTENFKELDILIINTDNGYEIDMGNSELVYVEADSVLGWHCYGNVSNDNLALKIEDDLENYFEIINNQYYCY